MNDFEFLAQQAAIQSSSPAAVGNLIDRVEESEPGVVTYRFECKLKGYIGWHWAVSLFFEGEQVSISEVNLMAGEKSVLAPKWVPWSERLADYKELQAALELQAAEEAAEAAEAAAAAELASTAEDDADDEDDEDDDFDEVEEVDEADESSANEAVGNSDASSSGVPVTEDSQEDADQTSSDEVSFFRIFRRSKKRK